MKRNRERMQKAMSWQAITLEGGRSQLDRHMGMVLQTVLSINEVSSRVSVVNGWYGGCIYNSFSQSTPAVLYTCIVQSDLS